MKLVSIMEAQHNLARVLREVEAGNVVGITRRKKLVARLMPPEKEAPVGFPDFEGRAREIWGEEWTGSGTDELLDETRGDR
jgi:antitoxin (DNA-binding transcriptional repressor) of toxin-antitoxin stability system